MQVSKLLRNGSVGTRACAHSLLPTRQFKGRSAAHWLSCRSVSQGRVVGGRKMASTATSVPDVFVEGDDPEVSAFQQHQRTAVKPSPAEQARTLVETATFGVVSTLSSKDPSGFPFGAVIQIAADAQGRPIFAGSSLSPHARDLLKDPRCALTLMAAGWKGPQEARLTLVGSVAVVKEEEKPQVRETFLKKHPSAFWVDFGDFNFFRLDDIKTGNLVPGFGGGYKIKAEEYLSAASDPVTPVSARVCKHMNEDHEKDIINMVKHYVGLTVEKARMQDIDRLGMNLFVTRQGAELAMRLPYTRPISAAKEVKEVLVEMSKASR